jgi:seryl-tRNA synthetase
MNDAVTEMAVLAERLSRNESDSSQNSRDIRELTLAVTSLTHDVERVVKSQEATMELIQQSAVQRSALSRIGDDVKRAHEKIEAIDPRVHVLETALAVNESAAEKIKSLEAQVSEIKTTCAVNLGRREGRQAIVDWISRNWLVLTLLGLAAIMTAKQLGVW